MATALLSRTQLQLRAARRTGFLLLEQNQRQWWRPRSYATESAANESKPEQTQQLAQSPKQSSLPKKSSSTEPKPRPAASPVDPPARSSDDANASMPPGWEDDPNWNISAFSQLPHRNFGFNQHMVINAEFKEALRQVLWQFRAPIRYAFAYGSGVFPQTAKSKDQAITTDLTPHPNPPEAVKKWQTSGGKVIDFIFGVSYTQHWHSLNIQQHRNHYSFLGTLGSGVVSRVQDNLGAGAYFNPYITVNGMMIKYGVVNLDTIYRDLSEWDTLYIAGRLQKPVKILRDDPRMRLANQINLMSAVRTALLMLPAEFTEKDLFNKITGISYMGDPRMLFKAENPKKVSNIVNAQMTNFRQLYLPLIENLPNVDYVDPTCKRDDWMGDPEANCKMQQDMDTKRRGNMVRRLPKAFRTKLYNNYQGILNISSQEFEGLIGGTKNETVFTKRTGTDLDKKIANQEGLSTVVADVVKKTVAWPTVVQTFKGLMTAGFLRGWKYLSEKRTKGKAIKKELKTQPVESKAEESSDEKEEQSLREKH